MKGISSPTPFVRKSGDVMTGDLDMAADKKVDGVDVSTISPVGHMIIWNTDTAPTGWFLCFGQAVNRTTYAALFAVLGTTFGVGDGSTTFNLPDLRGRLPLGQDNMGGTPANRVTNAQDVSAVSREFMPTGSTGGNSAHNNVQPYLTTNYIIKH